MHTVDEISGNSSLDFGNHTTYIDDAYDRWRREDLMTIETTNISEACPAPSAAGPYPPGRPGPTGRLLNRYLTWPHIRGACIYDGDRIIAVGPIWVIEAATEQLNRNYLQDANEVLRAWGLSG
jgi:hypothetical protein